MRDGSYFINVPNPLGGKSGDYYKIHRVDCGRLKRPREVSFLRGRNIAQVRNSVRNWRLCQSCFLKETK